MPCDPRQPEAVAAATLRWMHENFQGAAAATWEAPLEPADAGMTTFIWFGQLRGDRLPAALRTPIALRVFGNADDDETLQREQSILTFVAARGFPAPVPVATVAIGPDNRVGLPWMILPRVPGERLLTVITRAPWAAATRLRELAALQAQLHAIPVAECPLPADAALVDRWLLHRGPEIERLDDARADAVLGLLRARAAIVRDEEPVVCHGDFHPLNVLSRRTGRVWQHVVIDWTDAVVGDRHFDVARTLALFRVASIAASSPAERAVLRLSAPGLARIYRRAYERERALDNAKLAYWSAAHLLRGWAQIAQLHGGGHGTTRATAEAVPMSVAEAVLTGAERAAGSLSRH